MSVKELALQDIKEDLKQENKFFIPFITKLNPVMRKLTTQYQRQQGLPIVPKTQLIAHCFFCKATSTVEFNNYSKYYGKVQKV
jgi:hypothetical protein